MKSAVETISATRVRISIDVDFTDLEPHVKQAYQSISERIVIPGFRKGKVPRAMIDQRVGRGAVLDEAINNALPEFYTQAARENDVLVVGRPSVDIKELKDNELVKFEVEVDVRPEIKLPDFSKIEISVDDVAVADKDVEEQIEALRIRFGTLTTVEKDAASGDFVSIDLVARVDGKDYSAFHIFDVETFTQVGEYRGQIGTKEYGHMLVAIATEYNNALLVIENANIGWNTIQVVIDKGYQNLYYSPKGDAATNAEAFLATRKVFVATARTCIGEKFLNF